MYREGGNVEFVLLHVRQGKVLGSQAFSNRGLEHPDPEVLARVASFGEEVLGKGIVYGKDTPNFIANRVGTYALMKAIALMTRYGFSIEDVIRADLGLGRDQPGGRQDGGEQGQVGTDGCHEAGSRRVVQQEILYRAGPLLENRRLLSDNHRSRSGRCSIR